MEDPNLAIGDVCTLIDILTVNCLWFVGAQILGLLVYRTLAPWQRLCSLSNHSNGECLRSTFCVKNVVHRTICSPPNEVSQLSRAVLLVYILHTSETDFGSDRGQRSNRCVIPDILAKAVWHLLTKKFLDKTNNRFRRDARLVRYY